MRAKPILSLTLLAAALVHSGIAASLGLGKLTVQSSLGQPLSAQIEITSVAKEELDSVTARIADSALYRQNNLAYQSVLSRARVTMERLPSGDAVLKVTTPQSVSEPYLDLLVEVNWASGRVVRAYTFLLDPPGATVPVAPIEPVTPVRAGAAAAPRAASPAAAPGAAASARPPGGGGGGDSYTVHRGDTLSRIADDYRPSSATLEQMLVALYANNKDAFDGNMNRLRAGSILNIPSAEVATAISAAEASRQVRVQAADWRGYQDRVAAAAPAAEGAGTRATGGQIGTTVEEKTPAVVPGRDQLKVSPQAATGKGAVGAAPLQEEVVSRDKALKEAQNRINELEKTLRELQKAIELKGQTGAQLQAQAEAAKGAAPEAPKTAAPAASAGPAANATDAVAPKVAEAPKPIETAPAKAPEAPKVADATKSAPKSDMTKLQPKPEPSFLDDLFGGTPAWVIGGGALAALGGIAALIAARRRKTVKFEDSIIGGTDIKTNTVFGSTGGGVVNTGENSLATDFSREGLGNIDTDEVDPIAEAEVYLAYGRDAQAEEILKDALKKDPQRQEIYLKLLEIHAQHNKPSAFETVAAELYSVSTGQGDVWKKAVGLGRQLDPNNPMFGDGSGAAAAAAAAAAAVGASAAKAAQHEERKDASRAAAAAPAVKEADEDAGLDFRFDEDVSVRSPKPVTALDKINAAEREFEESAKRAPATAKASESVSTAAHAAAAMAATAATVAAKGFGATEGASAKTADDFEFTLEDGEKPAPMGKAAAEARPEGDTVSPALARPQAAIELDKLDLSFDPKHTTFEDPTPSVADGQWHDAATKLDLAKAYQEMGDVEGAREILQEVLHEGDDNQKAEAQALLAKLG
ncbi:MAG TPA: FimV/HubP family polar landmark protein [Casimicrobiaceae bacterium]|nr:FimV/HubP family polar landmark protein [Casimicrobiaceae bacterium]